MKQTQGNGFDISLKPRVSPPLGLVLTSQQYCQLFVNFRPRLAALYMTQKFGHTVCDCSSREFRKYQGVAYERTGLNAREGGDEQQQNH